MECSFFADISAIDESLTLVICIPGTILNIINVRFLFNAKMQPSLLTVLATLCISDAIFMILSITNQLIPRGRVRSLFAIYFRDRIGAVIYNGIIWLFVVLTIERYSLVVRPLKARMFFTRRNVRITIVVLHILLTIIDIPQFFSQKVTDSGNYDVTDMGKSHTYMVLGVVYFMIMHVIPLCVVLLFSVLIIRFIRKANVQMQMRVNMSTPVSLNRKREQLRLTLSSVVMALLFFFTSIPTFIDIKFFAISLFTEDYENLYCSRTYKIFYLIANMMIYTNCSLNFIILVIFSKTFRSSVKKGVFRLQHMCKISHRNVVGPDI